MRLTGEQSKRMYLATGSWFSDVCDKCGTAIHYMNRFTHMNQSGVWCSRRCRDGVERKEWGHCQGCGQALVGKRKGTLYCSNTCRMRFAPKSKVLNGPKLDANAIDSKEIKNTL